jgi:predicted TIM-barrel fold metal-dependent hydrolase
MVKPGIRIVDAHFHLWDLDENYYPWLSDGGRSTLIKDFSTLRRNYLISDLLHDIGDLNVIAGVHIQAEHDYRDHVRETRWLQRVADSPMSRGIRRESWPNARFRKQDRRRVLEGIAS